MTGSHEVTGFSKVPLTTGSRGDYLKFALPLVERIIFPERRLIYIDMFADLQQVNVKINK